MLLSSDQFDILVKIINSALTDNKSAIALLPVSTIMYRVSEGGMEGGRVAWPPGEGERDGGSQSVSEGGREGGRDGMDAWVSEAGRG